MMKKRWKNFWITIIILVVVGSSLCVAGLLLGADTHVPLECNVDLPIDIEIDGLSIKISGEGLQGLDGTIGIDWD